MIGCVFVERIDVRLAQSILRCLLHHHDAPRYCDATEGRARQFLLSWSSRSAPPTERLISMSNWAKKRPRPTRFGKFLGLSVTQKWRGAGVLRKTGPTFH